jgi:hypothetical protein
MGARKRTKHGFVNRPVRMKVSWDKPVGAVFVSDLHELPKLASNGMLIGNWNCLRDCQLSEPDLPVPQG